MQGGLADSGMMPMMTEEDEDLAESIKVLDFDEVLEDGLELKQQQREA